MLFFIGNTVILGGNGSIPWYGRDERAVSNQEGLHLVTLGDGLTCYFVVRFNIFFACQTHLVQSELLVRDATGMQFGDCVFFRFEQSVIGAVDTICS